MCGSCSEQCYIGDSCVTWFWKSEISRQRSFALLSIYRVLKEDEELSVLGMLDVVPAYCSLAVYFDPAGPHIDKLIDRADSIIKDAALAPEGFEFSGRSTYIFDVVYDGADLTRVSDFTGLSIPEIIDTHTRPLYTVAMIGFLPHFPYLIGLDESLATPRLKSPRIRVPSGSVAIGGAQAGIYPTESPGGWNLIGSTNPSQLKLIKPGDSVMFREAAGL